MIDDKSKPKNFRKYHGELDEIERRARRELKSRKPAGFTRFVRPAVFIETTYVEEHLVGINAPSVNHLKRKNDGHKTKTFVFLTTILTTLTLIFSGSRFFSEIKVSEERESQAPPEVKSLSSEAFPLQMPGPGISQEKGIEKDGCQIGGCGSEICAEEEALSVCRFRPEAICYKDAVCGRAVEGKCGWESSPELKTCLEEYQ